MLSIFIEDSPRMQLLTGVFFLLAGLVIFPTMLRLMLPMVEWMNGFWSHTDWWQTSFHWTKRFFILPLSMFVLIGSGRLAIYSFVKAGIMQSPWQ